MELKRLLTSRDWQILFATIGLIWIPTLIFSLLRIWIKSIHMVDIILFATLMAITIYTWKTWQLKDLTAELLNERSKNSP